ncbi:hypothetical protein Goshw_004462 [Gossypium schwendimanii]|uniref:Uncharacterized protein n=1 Tax=Gossypium schwendimanii TaxID=34291 RepID=A0A7J9KW57_GOSSC|nr:hypothetical protein [Gossypium schwendimanii]
MSDSDSMVAQQIALFHSQINQKRFNDDSLRILESVLASNDVKSLFQLRSTLKEFIRSESLSAIRHIAAKTVDQQLSTLEFFSCLALRYEALVLREHNSQIHQWLQVSPVEWLNFAEQSLDNCFYAIAAKACDYGLSCFHRNEIVRSKTDESCENLQLLEKITKLKNCALTLAASRSVKAQAAEYLRKRASEECNSQPPICKPAPCAASILYRDGIKKRNDRKLNASRRTVPSSSQL